MTHYFYVCMFLVWGFVTLRAMGIGQWGKKAIKSVLDYQKSKKSSENEIYEKMTFIPL